MSSDDTSTTTDLIRWTFTVAPAHAEAVETYLGDLGADVFVRDGGNFHVTWEEPEIDLDAVVEAVWDLVGTHFEITQEEFHRLAIHLLQHEVPKPHPHADAPTEYHPGFDSLEAMDL